MESSWKLGLVGAGTGDEEKAGGNGNEGRGVGTGGDAAVVDEVAADAGIGVAKVVSGTPASGAFTSSTFGGVGKGGTTVVRGHKIGKLSMRLQTAAILKAAEVQIEPESPAPKFLGEKENPFFGGISGRKLELKEGICSSSASELEDDDEEDNKNSSGTSDSSDVETLAGVRIGGSINKRKKQKMELILADLKARSQQLQVLEDEKNPKLELKAENLMLNAENLALKALLDISATAPSKATPKKRKAIDIKGNDSKKLKAESSIKDSPPSSVSSEEAEPSKKLGDGEEDDDIDNASSPSNGGEEGIAGPEELFGTGSAAIENFIPDYEEDEDLVGP